MQDLDDIDISNGSTVESSLGDNDRYVLFVCTISKTILSSYTALSIYACTVQHGVVIGGS